MNIKGFKKGKMPVREQPVGMYKDFDATQLYCPKCKSAMPVKKRLLLVLPDGDKYEYRCAHCLESLGTKIDRQPQPVAYVGDHSVDI